ncbi:MAG: BrnA antitoxin family protein [Cellvibrionaceae bacterium]
MNKKYTSKTRPSPASKTDWERVDAMSDDDIDLSDIPEITPEQFAKSIVRKGLKPTARKKQITLRIDEDVLEWFKHKGPGYQTQINELLREYVKAHNDHK